MSLILHGKPETYDIPGYGTGYLGISVRFLDNSTSTTRFYRLIKLDTESSGKELYDILCETILLNDIRKNNLIALCTDGASTMCGENKGVATRIAQVVPHLFWLHCASHYFNLIIEKTSSACLGDIISLVKEITSTFSFFNISHAILHEIQREGEVKERKILRYVPTRWLSLGNSVKRILEEWKSLQSFII